MNQWDQLQPNEIGDQLLHEWALWNRDSSIGGGGGDGYLREKLDQAHDGRPPETVELAEQVLAKVKATPELRVHWRVVKHYYLGGKSVEEVFRAIDRTPGFTRLILKEITDIVAERVRRLQIAA